MEVPRRVISPLEKIPREILCEFFLHATDSMFPLTIPPRQLRELPWTLAQVCSLWRDVLFGISGVWENVEIRNDINDTQIPATLNIFRTILSRSAAQISLFAPYNNQLFTNLIIPNLIRLRGLETIVGQDSFQTLFELPEGSVNSLASIDLHFTHGDLPNLRSNSFRTSPNLRKVTLTDGLGTSREWPSGSWLLPWVMLTDITFPNSIIPIPTLHIILGQCACLRNATLVVGSDRLPGLLGEEVIVPMLESLVLNRYGQNPNWEAFFRPLILPSFQSIIVSDAQSWSQTMFTSLIVRSACPLESLYLAYYRDTTYDLHSLLKNIPSLRKLKLPWLFIPASIFEAMRRQEILPMLMQLECIVDAPGLTAVLDLVESSASEQPGAGTSNVGIQLASLVWFDEDGLNGDLLERYHSLRPKFLENGRNIVIIAS